MIDHLGRKASARGNKGAPLVILCCLQQTNRSGQRSYSNSGRNIHLSEEETCENKYN